MGGAHCAARRRARPHVSHPRVNDFIQIRSFYLILLIIGLIADPILSYPIDMCTRSRHCLYFP